MAPDHPGKASQAEFDVIQSRIAIALAKRESLVKSWNTSSSQTHQSTKTEEELDAEDLLHFRREPANLGVGALIPSHFLVSEAQQNNKSLRAKFFPLKGLKASKARDAEEKAISAKRAKREDSSDEEEGRSSLGKAKKQKIGKNTATAVQESGTKPKQKNQTELNDFVPGSQGGSNVKTEMDGIMAEMKKPKSSSYDNLLRDLNSTNDQGKPWMDKEAGSAITGKDLGGLDSSTSNEDSGTASPALQQSLVKGNGGETMNRSKEARKKKKRNKRKEQRAAK